MKPIAIWYHGLFTGRTVPIDLSFSCSTIEDQMHALKSSGLVDAASEVHLCINGDTADANIARLFCPSPATRTYANGVEAQTEIPTLNRLREWLPGHPDWYVLYLHMRGVSHPGSELDLRWRKCMERYLILNWRACMTYLERGFESCGCHWLTGNKYPGMVGSPFWGGNFWWAKAGFLLTLPALPTDTRENRFAAESWIGSGLRPPTVADFHSQWPSMACG